MKTLFLLHDSWTQWVKADYAASLFPFDGFVVIERTRPWFGEYLWKRTRRLGLRKVAGEVAFRLFYAAVYARRDHRFLARFLGAIRDGLPAGYTRPPVYRVRDINSDEARELLRGLAPDVCVVMVNVLLKEKIFSIPPLGMLVFHPGVTPEYRGAHSAFWAVRNEEFLGIGWSLLRLNAGVDTGAVLAQASTASVDPAVETHVVMQHKAHIDGIPGVVETLRSLARGERPVVPTAGRKSANYTHPGLGDYFQYAKIVKRLRRAAKS